MNEEQRLALREVRTAITANDQAQRAWAEEGQRLRDERQTLIEQEYAIGTALIQEFYDWVDGPVEPVLKSAADWSAETGVSVIDPDGWRRIIPGGLQPRPWSDPITREEFAVRANMSTRVLVIG